MCDAIPNDSNQDEEQPRTAQRTVYCGSGSGTRRMQSEEVFLTFPFIVIAIYRIHIFLTFYLLFVSASRDFHFHSNNHADRFGSEWISLGWLVVRHYARPIRHQCNSFIALRWRWSKNLKVLFFPFTGKWKRMELGVGHWRVMGRDTGVDAGSSEEKLF